MSDYLVSARKYRPQNFNEVVGQSHVTIPLQNTINNKKIGHAYLFCGPRGVGKTTCARIFAKAVNNNLTNNYNLFELDGASNNGVDQIRTLIEQVKIPPQSGKYKVYIIDEVHMLSQQAFNAFLKTLEEPPKHSIFILATTEKNKLIPTILSRCQIFDFKKITDTDISDYLEELAKNENIEADKKTFDLIATKSNGSLRDSLSTFDKIYSYYNNKWLHQDILQLLSSLDISFSIGITNHIVNKDISSCLLDLNSVITIGFEAKDIIDNLISHFRNLIVAYDPKTAVLINENTEDIEILKNQANSFSKDELITALECLHSAESNCKKSSNPRFLLELCLMQLCNLGQKKKRITPIDPSSILNTQSNTQSEIAKENISDPNSNEVHKLKIDNPIALNNSLQTKEDNNLYQQLDHNSNLENNTPSKNKEIINNSDLQINDPKKNKIDSRSSLISITQELHQNKTDTESVETIEQTKEWSEKDMIQCWKEFSEELKGEKKINVYNIFERYMPDKKGNNMHLEVVSLSEKAAIEEVKGELLILMKKKLSNDLIKFIISVTEKEEKNMLYTNKEKYMHMVEKNKSIELLKEKLDLSIL